MYKTGWFGVVRDHSRSLEIAPFEACEFLLAFHCKYVHILHCVWVIATHSSKIPVF